MHVEISLDAQNNTSQVGDKSSRPEDTQTISGSQVACAFASIESAKTQQDKQGRVQVIAVSMSAVFAVVSVYLVFALVL